MTFTYLLRHVGCLCSYTLQNNNSETSQFWHRVLLWDLAVPGVIVLLVTRYLDAERDCREEVSLGYEGN